jgi:ABC-type transport system involved in cytochrome c biogenesis permease subunit
MNTTTTTAPKTIVLGRPGFLARRSLADWLFAALITGGGAYAFQRYRGSMDGYEQAILVGAIPVLVALGWFWSSLRTLAVGVGAAALLAIALYSRATDGFGADLSQAENVFLLKYFLSSQSAILWMSVLFFLSTLLYWIGMLARGEDNTALKLGSVMAWAGVALALAGTLVRWYESHQIGPDIGHIPVSNLYEVFVMFCWMTALFYLYYEQHYRTRALGAFVMLVVSAAVGFLLWYTVARDAHEIQPLVPALQSWWMKLHVPANFIGYGTFSLAAMVAFAFLVQRQAGETNYWKLAPLALMGIVLCLQPVVFRKNAIEGLSHYWAVYFGVAALIVGGILAAQAHRRAPAGARGAGRRDVQVHRRRLRVLHHRHHPWRLLGRRGLGRLLELGPEGDVGIDRLAELRGLAAHAADEGPAGRRGRLVGAGRAGRDDVRVPGREHVPVRAALVRRAVTARGGRPL